MSASYPLFNAWLASAFPEPESLRFVKRLAKSFLGSGDGLLELEGLEFGRRDVGLPDHIENAPLDERDIVLGKPLRHGGGSDLMVGPDEPEQGQHRRHFLLVLRRIKIVDHLLSFLAWRTELPPQGEIMASPEGLTAWRAVFDQIIVRPLPNGRKLLRIHQGEHSLEFTLNAEQAEHLATLLKANPTPPRSPEPQPDIDGVGGR